MYCLEDFLNSHSSQDHFSPTPCGLNACLTIGIRIYSCGMLSVRNFGSDILYMWVILFLYQFFRKIDIISFIRNS